MSETETKKETSPLPDARAPLLRAHLAGVALTSPDPHRLADFYASTMGYAGQWRDSGWSGQLDGRGLSIREGAENAIDHVVFALPDEHALADLTARLASASAPWREASPDMPGGASILLADPDGNRVVFAVTDRQDAAATGSVPCRLQHIVFASDDMLAMVRFYCDILGFAPSDYVMDEDGDLTSAFLRCSREHHSLAVFRAPRKRLDHLCYDVADWLHIRDWADAFSKHRVVLRWGPGRHGPGDNLFFFVNDPDGNWLEFSAELEDVPGSRDIGSWPHEERTLNYWGSAFLRS